MKKILSLALALIMVLGLVACGGGGSTTTPSGTTSTPSGTTSTPAGTTDTPKEVKNTINFGLGGAVETTDPHANNKEYTTQTFQWVYESLVYADGSAAVAPALAESWEVKNDGKDYVFKLRQGVKFHSGNTMTADDVVFSMQRALGMSFMKNYTGAIDTIEKTGDMEVTFHLKSANNGFIYQLFMLKVVEKAIVEKEGDNFGNAATLAGTGPYMYDSYDPNTLVVFKKFNDYWGECGNIETINCHVVTNSSTRVTALQTGELDFINVPSANWDKIQSSGQFATWQGESSSTCCIIVNHNKSGPLQDLRVRQALRYAINIDALIQVAAGGLGSPAEIMCNPQYIAGATVDDQLKASFPYNPDKAKELLKEAGYPDGVQLGIFLIPNKNDNEAVSQVLQNMWEQVGIKINLELAESSTASTKSKTGDYQDVYITVSNMVLHMADQKRGIHSSTLKTQVAKYNSPELDGYLDGGEAALTDAERDAIYLQANHWLDDMCVNVPLYYQHKTYAWDKALDATITTYYLYVQNWNWT